MPENDDWIDRYVRLRKVIKTPLCAPETAEGAHEVRIRWIEAGATDMGRLDVFYGGFTSCWKVAQFAFSGPDSDSNFSSRKRYKSPGVGY